MGGFFRKLTGEKAARETGIAGREAAAAQQEALDYLKEREAIPREFSEAATEQFGGLFGLGDVSGEEALANIQGTPIYQAIMGQRESGEEAILRNAAATGGLRSGNVQDALARYSGDLETQALTQSLSGLQGLANLPSNANQIAGLTANIGQTLAQSRIGSAQTQQAGLMGLLNTAIGGAEAVAAFSDARLKDNIKPAGQRNGHNWYTWDWSEEAEALGLSGPDEGVMAHEIIETVPEAVRANRGYLTVDYSALGVH